MPQLPKFPKRKKLRAATARRSFGASTDMDYEEMSEPNMKLSRALLIVLVLHIVAVAGIIAFNVIKTRQGSVLPASLPSTSAESLSESSTAKPAAAVAKSVPVEPAIAPRDETKSSHSPAKATVKVEHKSEHAKPLKKATASVDSAKTYVVIKGDNPVTIARKFKVPYNDLIALNHIEDARKLQIGQKLLIPKKAAKAKKTSE